MLNAPIKPQTSSNYIELPGGITRSADTTERIIRLKRFEHYSDPMDRWLFLLEPLP
jgi:hypothetical protein